MAESKVIPIVCGPTGSGKTAVALELAKTFPIEIVSADSRQIVKHLDIGTAKPTREEQRAVRTHLIDLIEPGERYSAFRFIDDADRVIRDIIARGHKPIVVGGTGLYLRALSEGVVEIEQDSPEIRDELQTQMEELGPEAMHQRLSELDPAEAARIHPNNRVRVIRALEIHRLTGCAKSELMASGAYKKSSYEYAYFCLLPEREALYDAINRRVDRMMRLGLLGEIDDLLKRGLGPALRRANVIGYEELLDHLEGRSTLAEAVEKIRQNSRRYAKRQITWFRHQVEGQLFTGSEPLWKPLETALSDGRAKG